MVLAAEETRLLQALFQRYARLVLESEFLSGYSGARTFLAHPVLLDGSADAATIVKLGPRASVSGRIHQLRTLRARPPAASDGAHPARAGDNQRRLAGGAAVHLYQRTGQGAAKPAPGAPVRTGPSLALSPVRYIRPALVAAAQALCLPGRTGIRPPAPAAHGVETQRAR